jgi:hypothetical protein
LGGGLIEMKRLRVIGRGEGLDLRRIERMRAADELLPEAQVFKEDLTVRTLGFRCHACLPGA